MDQHYLDGQMICLHCGEHFPPSEEENHKKVCKMILVPRP